MQKHRSSIRLTGFQLKYIALVTMAIDHFGAVFLPGISPLYEIFRGIGRIAFPLYCFLLAEGYYHTSNKKSYFIRLFLFALISELPFDLAFYHFPRTHSLSILMGHQNVFFTLSAAFLAIWILDHFWFANRTTGFFGALILALFAEVCHFDYGFSGIITVILFFLCHKKESLFQDSSFQHRPILTERFFHVLACFSVLPAGSPLGLLIFMTIPLLSFYDGTKGTALPGNMTFPGTKYIFYAFYPVHLTVLGILWLYLY